MPTYGCDLCNYQTGNKADYRKHLKTKKHVRKENELAKIESAKKSHDTPQRRHDTSMTPRTNHQLICQYCGNEFSRTSSLLRHQKICFGKSDRIRDLEMELEEMKRKYENEKTRHECSRQLLEKDIEMRDVRIKGVIREGKMWREQFNTYKTIAESRGNRLAPSASSMKQITEKYPDAPALKEIDAGILKTIGDGSESDISEEIFYHVSNRSLHKLIGGLVVTVYLKKKPQDQSLWNTDFSRMNYFIKKFISEKHSVWTPDKGGVETVKKAIDPLLTEMRKIVKCYLASNDLEKAIDKERAYRILRRSYTVMEMIDTGTLREDILRYITDKFHYGGNGSVSIPSDKRLTISDRPEDEVSHDGISGDLSSIDEERVFKPKKKCSKRVIKKRPTTKTTKTEKRDDKKKIKRVKRTKKVKK